MNRSALPIVLCTEQGKNMLIKNGVKVHSSEHFALDIVKVSPEDYNSPVKRDNAIVLGKEMFMYPVSIIDDSLKKHPLEGLWTAVYSTHGIELLQFSIKTQKELNESKHDNTIDEKPGLATYRELPRNLNVNISNYNSEYFPKMPGGTRLVAHKITGDYNIAADTDSFVVYLDSLEVITERNFGTPLKYPLKYVNHLLR